MRSVWSYVAAALLALGWAGVVLAEQRVTVPMGEGEPRAALVEKGYEAALGQEAQAVLGTSLAPARLKAVTTVLMQERVSLILGHSETAVTEGNATAVAFDVRVNTAGVKNRLRELGVMFTATSPLPYVLQLSGVEPSRTKRLGALQELSGLQPVASAGDDVPTLQLSQVGAWSGVLSLGEWRASHTAKTLDEVWFAVWKEYFSRPGLAAKGEDGVMVRVSGWLSSMGPMEFDRLMDSWTAEVDRKTLLGVELEGGGMTGVWRVQTRSRDALVRRLGEAAKAQGLTLEVR